MSRLLVGILICIVLYFEWDLVKCAIMPLISAVVCVASAFAWTSMLIRLALLFIIEIALIVIAPTALFLGLESREWHRDIALKIMGKKQ